VISLPSRLVESAIATSVVLAALNNVFPLVHGRRWMCLLFGLVHGFGFASVLRDLGLPQNALLIALVGFNLGVEGGQLAIVKRVPARGVLAAGELVLPAPRIHRWFPGHCGRRGIWLVERAFNMKIITP